MARIQIEQIKDTIVAFFSERKINLNKIVFFGSHYNGVPNKDSDIDLLVFSKDFEGKDIFQKSKTTDGLEWMLVKKYKMPFDIIYYSDSEWDSSDSIIITEAKRNGKIIYS